MPRFYANLAMLHTEHGFLDRFVAAAADGFNGVEFLSPHEHPKDQVAERLQEQGLIQVLRNLPAGDWAGGGRGIACPPGR